MLSHSSVDPPVRYSTSCRPTPVTALHAMLFAMTGGRLSVPGLPLPYAYASALP